MKNIASDPMMWWKSHDLCDTFPSHHAAVYVQDKERYHRWQAADYAVKYYMHGSFKNWQLEGGPGHLYSIDSMDLLLINNRSIIDVISYSIWKYTSHDISLTLSSSVYKSMFSVLFFGGNLAAVGFLRYYL